MNFVEVKFSPWDKIYLFNPKNFLLAPGDKVVAKTAFGSIEIGTVIRVRDLEEKELKKTIEAEGKIESIIRKVNLSDWEKWRKINQKRGEVMEFCQKLIKKHQLPMKLVDVRFSLDGSKLVYAFIAKGRVDFRELVKDLTHHFQKSVRLQQINVREEAKLIGAIGPCGRELCCRKFLKEPGNISLEKAQHQQIINWGPERLTGICGRLKCCLAFEDELYQELAKNMPPLGSKIKTNQGEGEVVDWHILKQTVEVRIDEDTIVEVPLKNKKLTK